jgi:hypothetical protein
MNIHSMLVEKWLPPDGADLVQSTVDPNEVQSSNYVNFESAYCKSSIFHIYMNDF